MAKTSSGTGNHGLIALVVTPTETIGVVMGAGDRTLSRNEPLLHAAELKLPLDTGLMAALAEAEAGVLPNG